MVNTSLPSSYFPQHLHPSITISFHLWISFYGELIQFYVAVVGERSKDKENLLQKQGVQEAHLTQSHPIQKG